MKVTIDITTIGDYLKLKMQERNKGVRDVALEIGMSPATVSRITTGHNFNLCWLIPLAKWCNLNPQELWDLLSKDSESPRN